MRTTKLSAVSLLILIAACNKDNNLISPGIPKDLWPLAIGNRWVHTITNLDSNGTATSLYTDSILVLQDTLLENHSWSYTNSGIYRNSPEGLWVWIGAPLLVFKYPANAGDSYTLAGIDTVKVLSTSESISVPYGILSCYHYRRLISTLSGNIELNYFLSPGVGLVSFENYNWGIRYHRYVDSRAQLKSYFVR